jgi:NAD-dependent SIR2 family protein deacetylase
VELLRPARRLLFITGAGLSADSRLPTHRGPGGLHDAGRTTPLRPADRGSPPRGHARRPARDHLAVPPEAGRGVICPVVLFGEELLEEKMDRLWSELEAGFGLVFSIRTSSVFPCIAAPVLLARGAVSATTRE